MLDQRKPFKGYIKNWRIHSMLKGHEDIKKGKQYLEIADFEVRPAVTRSASGWSLI